jgi:hypothetical protein
VISTNDSTANSQQKETEQILISFEQEVLAIPNSKSNEDAILNRTDNLENDSITNTEDPNDSVRELLFNIPEWVLILYDEVQEKLQTSRLPWFTISNWNAMEKEDDARPEGMFELKNVVPIYIKNLIKIMMKF